MRRCVAVWVTALACTLTPSGSAAAQWSVGLETGATVSTLSGSFPRGAESVLGATFGATIERRLGEAWILEADPAFTQTGAGSVRVGSSLVDFRFVYLGAPITVGRTFAILGGHWRVGPYAGAALSWLAGCGLRFRGQFHYSSCLPSTPGGEPSRLDVSLPVGVTLRHRYAGGSGIALDLRYAPSLTSVLDPGGLSARNRLVWIRFGFTLPLGGGG